VFEVNIISKREKMKGGNIKHESSFVHAATDQLKIIVLLHKGNTNFATPCTNFSSRRI